ncbi:AraC family transcriptional regulator [Actinomadura fulvescens]|uniref:AraC family transcriptional regulator n=1 Tax=Actinomadura fulvescens TaxID=46160 RepID=A0ABN3Q5N7_9ACTN
MAPSRTIAIHFVHSALRGARERGMDVWPVLLRASIPPALLGDSRARVTREQYAELIRGLWDALDDEFLGLGDFTCKRGTFAMMCLVVLGSPDLATALRRAADFYGLFPTRVRFRVETPEPFRARREVSSGGAALGSDHTPARDVTPHTNSPVSRPNVTQSAVFRLTIDLGGLPDPDHFVTECLVMIWHRVVGWAIDQRVPLVRLEFGHPPPVHVAEYGPIFGCPMSYGHPVTGLVFDAAYLRAPIVQDEAALWARMANAPADLISPPRPASSYTDRVRRILMNGLGHGSLTETAARLTVSPQALRRHLQAEGVSFRAVKEEVLRDAAIAGLANGEQSVEEIAVRLGFADASAFHRAFKRWTGTTPGAYRTAR